MTIPAPSAPFAMHPQRRLRLLTAAVLLLLPALGVVALAAYRARQASTHLAQAQVRLDDALALEAAAARSADKQKLRILLKDQARQAGFASSQWEERRFNIRQATMSRDAVNALLAELGRSRGRLFAAEQFDISVARQEDDLFNPPTQAPADLLVTLRGRLVFRESGSRP